MPAATDLTDHGETLTLRILVEGGSLPVVISREALAVNFGAGTEPGALARAYEQHADAINRKALSKLRPGDVFTTDHPMALGASDF